MNKRLICLLLLALLPVSFTFADDNSRLDKEDKKQEEVNSVTGSDDFKGLNGKLTGAGAASLPAKLIEDVYKGFTGEIEKTLKFAPFSSTEKKSYGLSVFQMFLVFFYLLSMAYFVFQKLATGFTGKKVNVMEVVVITLKCIGCVLVFSQLSQIPGMLVRLAQKIALVFWGVGDKEFTIVNAGLVSDAAVGTWLALGLAVSPAGMAIATPSGLGVKFDVVKKLGFWMIANAAAAIAGGATAALTYGILCMNLYLGSILMVFYLPATLFKSALGYDIQNVFKFFFVNFIQVFIMTFEVLLVKSFMRNGSFEPTAHVGALSFFFPTILPYIIVMLEAGSADVVRSFVSETIAETGRLVLMMKSYSDYTKTGGLAGLMNTANKGSFDTSKYQGNKGARGSGAARQDNNDDVRQSLRASVNSMYYDNN